jgi:hypothetical protein
VFGEPNTSNCHSGGPADLCGDGHGPSPSVVWSAPGGSVPHLWPWPAVPGRCLARWPPAPDAACCHGP